MARYPATYTDARGSEATAIENDGETLELCVRGVKFAGGDFDMLEPMGSFDPEQLLQFTLHQDDLCSCRIECQMPIPISRNGTLVDGVLHVELTLGDPAPNGGLDYERLRLILEFDGHRTASPGKRDFEDEMLGIQSQLPAGVFIKACINCLYSDYSPYGHGLFGGMMCFRNLKSEYLQVTTKREFWSVHGRQDRFVQETFLCPEFERRILGTGYRG